MNLFDPYDTLRPLIFKLDPEQAHHLTLKALGSADRLLPKRCPQAANTPLLGSRVRNLVGLAAGLDKNAEYLDGLSRLGFGFIEAGTVTPKPQPGNPRPRLFRIPEANAIINRMGFNNCGLDEFIRNIQRSNFRKDGGMLGLNIGKNAATPVEAAQSDYLIGLEAVYPHADYIAVNISSPNTKNLRDLQQEDQLDKLLNALTESRRALSDQHHRHVPLLLKIAPDLEDEQIMSIAQTVDKHQLEGIIATNTTLSREAVFQYEHGAEAGGLSGQAVHALSLRVIRTLREQLGKETTIIGVGGILSGDDALEKMQAGANAVQLYTGLIYRGPKLVRKCIQKLAAAGF